MKLHSAVKILPLALLLVLLASCATTKIKEDAPLWADPLTVKQVFPEMEFITAIANAQTKEMATNLADANLAAYFSQEVSSVTSASQNFSSNGGSKSGLQRNVEIKSQVELAGVEHTKTWYNKQEKSWYICSYLNRKKAWKLYEGNVIQEQNKFYSFYKAAESENDPFKKIALYKEAKSEGEVYSSLLMFAGILYEKGADKYQKDRLVISMIDEKISQTRLNLKVKVEVFGDIGNQYKKAIENVLTDFGFLVTEKVASYTVTANINSAKTNFSDTITAEPSVEIQFHNQSETLFSISKTTERISVFSEAESLVDRKIKAAVNKIVMEDFFSEVGKLAK